ncbi:MAG: type IV pilus secretin PilQ, partial [Nitrospiraceae bacterium]|nr:type IV pilus secretin PilQ [Nitrospiraceae bacterium]
MPRREPRTPLPLLFIFVFFIMLASGCAGNRQAAKAPFPGFEKWEKLARTSKGFSPSPVENNALVESNTSIANSTNGTKNGTAGLQLRPLPTQKVSLKMRDADVKSILRALAVSTGVNLLVPDDVKGTTSIDFTEVPWNQAFLSLLKSYGLSYVWQGDILRVLTLEDMEQSLKAEAVQRKLEAESPLTTVVVPINYADAKGLQNNLQKLLQDEGSKSVRGSVLVDNYSNSLIIHATPDDAKKMLSVIKSIDRPTGQILIRANIVETTREEARDLGIQWGGILMTNANGNNKIWVTPGGSAGNVLSSGSSGSGTSTSGGGTVTPSFTPTSGATGISQQGYGVNFPVPQSTILNNGIGSLGFLYGSLTGNILDAQLQALQTEGKVNIISSPSITTLDNQKAFTQSGTRVPYVTYTFSGSSTTPTVNFVDAALKLEITPHIINGGNLKMSVVINKDDVDTSREVQGNPFILQKQTETTLIVKNGETVVISGLTSQNLSSNVNGVPFLKDIPFLGWLFKGEHKDNTMNQVLIFITPYILPREAPVAAQAATLK